MAGRLLFTLDLDSLPGRVEQVALWVDDQIVATREAPPYAFSLNTPSYPEGEHLVSVRVDVRGRDGGLLGAAGIPDALFAVPLVFDQTRPSRVAGLTATFEGDRPRVQWTASSDPNFYAYIVHRLSPEVPGSGFAAVDTIYDRATAIYLDTPFDQGIGSFYEYQVYGWNRAEVSPSSSTARVTLGTSVPALNPYNYFGAFSPDGRTIYVSVPGALTAVSTVDYRELGRISDSVLSGYWPALRQLIVNPSSAEVYAFTSALAPRLQMKVLDPVTLSVRRSFVLPSQVVKVAFTPSGAMLGTGEGRFYILDPQTGDVLASSGAELAPYAELVGVSPDGRSAYVLSDGIQRVSLDDPDLRPAAQFDLPPSSTIIRVGADGRVYIYTHPTVTVLDGQSLQPVAEFSLGLPGGSALTAQTFVVAGSSLFIAHRRTRPDGRPGGTVASFNLATGLQSRTWQFAAPVSLLRTTGAGRLYVDSSSDTWVIAL